MTVDPQDIAKRLRESRETTKKETDALAEQLARVDVIIDEYDEVINKIDNKLPPLIAPINNKITAVQQAYLARIAHGCRSDLAWVQVGTTDIDGDDANVFQVQKDPGTFQFLGYYGAKFYKFPKNMEYGSNVVETLDSADANLDSNALILLDDDAETLAGFTTGVNPGIRTGDFITDDLDSPTIFIAGAGTSAIGFGLTDYAAYNYPLSGFCTTSDNKIFADKKIGIMTSFNVGDEVYGASDKSGFGIVATGTTITGFGTAVGIVSYVLPNGITTGVSVNLDFITLSQPVTASIASTIGHTFYVGMVSSYYFAELSAQPSAPGINSSFIIIRPGDSNDIEFESTKNPIDPVEIGIAQGANIGKGHKLELINNGDPNIIAKWREVLDEPEPAVGAGRVEYYVGSFNWPTYSEFDEDGDGDEQYATLGQTVIVSTGGTAGTTLGYKNVPPSGSIPGDCGTYDTAITEAENEMNNIIAQNVPRINHYISGASALRDIRNDEETTAWGYLQAIGFNNGKSSQQLQQALGIEDFDWDDILR